MGDKSLSKYSRAELLDLLYNQQKKIEELEAENKDLKQQIEDKKIRIDDCGSIAEASLKLTDIFKQAQEAADLYLENVKSAAQNGEIVKTAPARQNPQPVKQTANSVPVNNVRPQVQPRPQAQPRPQYQQPVQPRVQAQPQAQPRVQYQQQPQVQYRQVTERRPKPAPKPLINPRPMVQVLSDEDVINYSDYEAMLNDSPIMLDDVARKEPRRQVSRNEMSDSDLPKRAKRSNSPSRQQYRQTSTRSTKEKDLVKDLEMDILGQFDKVTRSDSSEQYKRNRHEKRKRSQ